MRSRQTAGIRAFRGGVGILCTAVLLIAAGTAMAAQGAAGSTPRWSWQEEQARVLPTGGLEWAPRPFVFEKGASVRYIDFAAGDDAKDGKTQQAPWKHHPWDANATGQAKACKGVQTYVFKGGVAYRGALNATDSGTPGNPIRLTRDPSWGTGEAIFCGSTQIRGGWKKANAEEAPGIPEPANVWYIDLDKDYDPDPDEAKLSSMWQVDGDKVERLHIAREPNYEFSDPNNPVKNWPVWSAYDMATGTFTSPFLKGLGDKGLLNGAVLWTEGGFLMAAATKLPIPPDSYDPDKGSVTIRSRANIGHYRNIPRAEVHFMVENVAKFLDAPGEYFIQLNGPRSGRLYLRPAGGVDPNSVVYEVAQIRFLICMTDQHDIVVSGLDFRYNDPDDGNEDWECGASPCVRIIGNCANITVSNCNFQYVANAVTACPHPDGEGGPANDLLDNIIVSDNDIQHAEKGGAVFVSGASQRVRDGAYGQLKHVEVMRNRLIDTGFRHGSRSWSSIPAISVSWPETCEIAGNIVDTSFGNGIITEGGKATGARNVVPLTRLLVHHNQVDNTMLGCNDYGGLEHFQGGPTYIYNNITRNCVGNRTLGRELGYSLYLDGGFKCYSFNNIIAGNVKADQPDYYNNCGYFMVFGFMDQLFNNTIYHFNKALDGSSGNRSNILGNLMLDCKESFIGQNRPGDVSMLGGGDTGAMGRTGIPTMSYASNVFFGSPTNFGCVAGISNTGAGGGAPVVPGKTLVELRDKLEAEKCRLASIGWRVDEPPLVDPARRDYRPTASSGARERGVKYFVPWALARNVGEWNFYKSVATPQVVLGEGFYMTDEYLGRGMYYFIPRNDLTVSACSQEDYVAGQLEDWIEGALVFDGKDRVASLSHAEMTKSMEYPGGRGGARNAYDGSRRETLDMGVNSFLIEVFFRTESGHTKGVLASKLADSGYELAVGPDGGPCLTIHAGGAKVSLASTARVNDGKWHHVIAEVDRSAGKATIYVDGKAAGEGKLDAIAKDATLSNTADFVVGKGFAGAVDFLRVCRSTLAESKTSIEELYAWEFDGPFLRDFCGVKPDGKRDAGALQHAGP
jgi:hypothetical protein